MMKGIFIVDHREVVIHLWELTQEVKGLDVESLIEECLYITEKTMDFPEKIVTKFFSGRELSMEDIETLRYFYILSHCHKFLEE